MKALLKKIYQGEGYGKLPLAVMLVAATLVLHQQSAGQEKDTTVPNGTDGLVLKVPPPMDSAAKRRPINEFDGSRSTFKIGFGYIVDYVNYKLSDEFQEQMDTAKLVFDPKIQTRDFRILGSGVLKTKRPISWKFAYMYDGDDKVWMMRESGVTVAVPELKGHIFVGRTKEGYSMVKVMNGHSPWTHERQMAIDVIPILADGIKWFGALPKSRIFWNVGYYNDFISKGQGFSTFEWQYSGRIGWLPYYDKAKNKVVHFAANLRYGKPLDGQIALKSRPESNPAPQIINTGTFKADHSNHIGAELYYSANGFLVGSEVVMHNFKSKDFNDHQFVGGDVVVSYLFTGAKRPYTTVGSMLQFVQVNDPVSAGGWGEWEFVLRLSSLDLNDKEIKGGKFWRLTPMVNWYMTKYIRMEFIYGYGVLDRYNISGSIHLFQARLQLTVL